MSLFIAIVLLIVSLLFAKGNKEQKENNGDDSVAVNNVE